MTSEQQDNSNTRYQIFPTWETNLSEETCKALFDTIADSIIQEFHPTSVLDAGCGKGHLVNALRERSVEAWGIDTSELSIQNALLDSHPFCQVRSILEPFPLPRYDLIICIDTIELRLS